MPLPDVSRLPSLPAERLRALAHRFVATDLERERAALARLGDGVFEPACRPLRNHRLRQRGDAVGHLMRLFCFDDPVTESEATTALGDEPLAPLIDAGLLTPLPGGLVGSALRLRSHEGVFFFEDDLAHRGDAVMGGQSLTGALIGAARGGRPFQRALDLGCGAGLCALLLAREAREVVATDINPRAGLLARVNMLLNGVTNIDVRVGDLFAPVEGERFDRVLSQPPFVAMPDGAAAATYLYGGQRGDELMLRACAEVPRYLTPEGRALFIANWPLTREEVIASRVRAVIGSEAGVLVLEAEAVDMDAICIGDAAADHPDLGADFARDVVARREHLERLAVTEVRTALTLLEPSTAAGAWTSSRAVAPLEGAGITAADLDALVATEALLARGDDSLVAAKLRLRPGIRFATGHDGSVSVIASGYSAGTELALDSTAHRLALRVDGAPNARTGLKRLAADLRLAPEQAKRLLTPLLRQLAVAGVLEAHG